MNESIEFKNIDCRFLLVGVAGSGKTNAIMNYIYRTSGTFAHIFICCKGDDLLYESLIEQLGKKINVYKSLDSFPDYDQFPDQTKDKYLCIFDDYGHEKSSAAVKKLNEYFEYSGGKGITACFTSQSKHDVPPFLKENMDFSFSIVSLKR